MKSRSKKMRINKVKLFAFFMVIVMIAAVGIAVKNVLDLRAEQQRLTKENKKLISQKEDLEEELKNVNRYDYIEEQARSQLKLVKPGEVIYIVEDNEDE